MNICMFLWHNILDNPVIFAFIQLWVGFFCCVFFFLILRTRILVYTETKGTGKHIGRNETLVFIADVQLNHCGVKNGLLFCKEE